MERDTSHLRHRERQDLVQSQQSAQLGVEFATADEMIRYDAEHTSVPGTIADRLNDSLLHEPKPARSLWERLQFWK